MELRHSLAEWTDWDVAEYLLGTSLGLFDGMSFSKDAKGVFWTDNAVGNGLHQILLTLADIGVVECRDAEDEQFRWSPTVHELRPRVARADE